MKRKPLLFFFCMITLLSVALSGDRVEGRNTVTPIDHAGFQGILKNASCPVMVVAMAAWCAPCRAELPTLGNLYRKYKDKGLNMIGLSLDVGGPGVIQPIVDRMDVPFPVFWGGDKLAFRYRISAIPLIMIVHKGEVTEKIIGQRSESFLEEKVTAMLTECKTL